MFTHDNEVSESGPFASHSHPSTVSIALLKPSQVWYKMEHCDVVRLCCG